MRGCLRGGEEGKEEGEGREEEGRGEKLGRSDPIIWKTQR
jgi:hypothetical protein